MRGKAYRRVQLTRAKLRATRYLRLIFMNDPSSITAKMIGHYSGNRKPCSCHMCGNVRRWTGEVTRQERLSKDVHREE
jgi:hypothetical protein